MALFNHALYLPRYLPCIEAAVSIYPRTYKIQNSIWSPVTNISRIRETRNFIIENIHRFENFSDSEARKNLALFQVWADDDYTYLGNPKLTQEVAPMTAAHTGALASDLNEPLTQQDLQALFYVLEKQLVTLPIRINSPSPTTVTEIERLNALCHNVEFTQSHDTITLF